MGKRIDREGGDPMVVIEGMEEITRKDLQKHKDILARTHQERLSYRAAVSHEVRRKKHYGTLIGGGKFKDDSLKEAMTQMAINITAMSNKIKLSDDKIEHESLVVDTLTAQLENQYKGLKFLAEHRKREADAH